MGVIEDILGIRKTETEPVDNPIQMPNAEQPIQAPIKQPVQADAIQSKTEQIDKGEALRKAYSETGSFYDALNQTFRTRPEIDEKQVRARKNLAGLSDFANNLGDIISASMGGNVVARNSSAVSDFDNKLLNYRRQIDERNRQYDVMRYQARLSDMQERIRRGEKIQDLLHRDARETVADNRYNEGLNFRNKQLERASGMQEKQFAQQQKNADRAYGLQKGRSEAAERIAVMRQMYTSLKDAKRGADESVDFVTNNSTYSLPKRSAKAIIPQLYSIMQADASKIGEDEQKLIDIKVNLGEGGDQISKMEAIVRTNINRYPRAEEFLKEYQSSVSNKINPDSEIEPMRGNPERHSLPVAEIESNKTGDKPNFWTWKSKN